MSGGQWVSWTPKGYDPYSQNPRATRAHFATVYRPGDDNFPLACGRWAPSAFDADISADSYARHCQRCDAAVARLSAEAAASSTLKWTRVDSTYEFGYRSGRYYLNDNGGGLGPASGSGRWALMVDNRWIANIDLLAEAKQRAQEMEDAHEQERL